MNLTKPHWKNKSWPDYDKMQMPLASEWPDLRRGESTWPPARWSAMSKYDRTARTSKESIFFTIDNVVSTSVLTRRRGSSETSQISYVLDTFKPNIRQQTGRKGEGEKTSREVIRSRCRFEQSTFSVSRLWERRRRRRKRRRRRRSRRKISFAFVHGELWARPENWFVM